MVLPIILAVMTGGGFAAAINAVVNRRRTRAESGKIDAEAAQIIANAAAALVGPLNERLGQHEQRIQQLEIRDAEKLGYIRTLLRWIAEHVPGLTPPEPPDLLRRELNP